MLSPPLLGYQPNFFVKRSLNSDCFLFSYAWKSLSISLCPATSFSIYIFSFAWKILSIESGSYVISSNLIVLIFPVPPYSLIFFLDVKITLCSMSFSVFFDVVSLFIITVSFIQLFILPWKSLSFLCLTAKVFSSGVKIALSSLSFFSTNCIFMTLHRYYFTLSNFLFLRENLSPFLIDFTLYMRFCVPCSFLFCLREIFSQ